MSTECNSENCTKLLKCTFNGCQATFGRKNRLEQHIRTHTGERPFKCQIEGCNQSYTRSFHLTRHVQSFHNKVVTPKFQCLVVGCGRLFTTQQNLRRHHSRIHEKVPEYSCKDCGKSFKKHQQLKIHLYEHTGVKPFICTQEGCGKSFLLPSKLKAHSKVHAGYTCDFFECGQHFNTWSLLQEHKKQTHKRVYKCDACEKVFTAKSTLRDHLHIHEETRQVFHCPIEGCTRWYYFERNVRMHIRSNHEIGNFECQVKDCGRKFKCKGSFKSHMIRHKKALRHERNTVKKQSKVRKDKGLPKKATASILSGHPASAEENYKIIRNVD